MERKREIRDYAKAAWEAELAARYDRALENLATFGFISEKKEEIKSC